MKKLNRLGIMFLVIGISLLLVMVLRDSSPVGPFAVGGSSDASAVSPSQWILYPDFLLPPRDLRVEIQANATVDVYILDEASTIVWNTDGTLRPTWTFKGISQEIFKIEVNTRGNYAILLHNPSNESVLITVSMTLYGFERDLLLISATAINLGILVIIVYTIISRKTKNMNH